MGSGPAKEDTVEMSWTCKYTPEQIIERARKLVGKPVTDPRLLPNAYSCIPFLAEIFEWTTPLPENWICDTSISQIEAATGCRFEEGGVSYPGEVLVFYVRGKNHVALQSSETSMIHAGYRSIIEIPFERFMKFYKGVIHPYA